MNTHRLQRAQSIASINIRNLHFTIGFQHWHSYIPSRIRNQHSTINAARQSHICMQQSFFFDEYISFSFFPIFRSASIEKWAHFGNAVWLEWVWFVYRRRPLIEERPITSKRSLVNSESKTITSRTTTTTEKSSVRLKWNVLEMRTSAQENYLVLLRIQANSEY